MSYRGFPGGLTVMNLATNVGNMGLISDFEKIPHASEQLNPVCHSYWVCVPRACAPQEEKPLKWEPHALQLESSPHLPQLEKSLLHMTKTQRSQK